MPLKTKICVIIFFFKLKENINFLTVFAAFLYSTNDCIKEFEKYLNDDFQHFAPEK